MRRPSYGRSSGRTATIEVIGPFLLCAFAAAVADSQLQIRTDNIKRGTLMNAEALVKLLEEMVDLKVQQYAQLNMKPNPEVARLLEEKRVTDRRRLEQIKAELVRLLGG